MQRCFAHHCTTLVDFPGFPRLQDLEGQDGASDEEVDGQTGGINDSRHQGRRRHSCILMDHEQKGTQSGIISTEERMPMPRQCG